MKKALPRILLLCGLLGIVPASWSASATTTLAVSATVVPRCTVAMSGGIFGFGSAIRSPINANIDVMGTGQVTCSAGTSYSVALSVGNGVGATFAARKLTSGPNTLTYSFYTDMGRTRPWGDGTAGSSVFNGRAVGTLQSFALYGRIPGGQSVPSGTYRDTLIISLNF